MRNKIILVGAVMVIITSVTSTIWYVYKNSLRSTELNTAAIVGSEYTREYIPNANDEIMATSEEWSIILRIEDQIGGAILLQRDSKGVQKIIAVDEDINSMIEKFVPTDIVQNLKKILKDREVNFIKNREVDKNPQGIVKNKNTEALPVFKLTYIEASDEVTGGVLDNPRTKVQIQYESHVYDIGTYLGSCTTVQGEELSNLKNEIAGLSCWWAGAGDELRIVDKGDRYIILHKEMEEGTAEGNGYESEYTEVKVLEVGI